MTKRQAVAATSVTTITREGVERSVFANAPEPDQACGRDLRDGEVFIMGRPGQGRGFGQRAQLMAAPTRPSVTLDPAKGYEGLIDELDGRVFRTALVALGEDTP